MSIEWVGFVVKRNENASANNHPVLYNEQNEHKIRCFIFYFMCSCTMFYGNSFSYHRWQTFQLWTMILSLSAISGTGMTSFQKYNGEGWRKKKGRKNLRRFTCFLECAIVPNRYLASYTFLFKQEIKVSWQFYGIPIKLIILVSKWAAKQFAATLFITRCET